MFKVENTGMHAWKRVTDDSGKIIADLDEMYSGDWALVWLNSYDRICPDTFSNSSRAVSWLWKNRESVGEPFSSYVDKKKKTVVKEQVVEQTEEIDEYDLFSSFGKPKRK